MSRITERERNERRKAAGYWKNLPAATQAKRKAYAAEYRAAHRDVINAARRKVKAITLAPAPIAGETLRERFLAFRKAKQIT